VSVESLPGASGRLASVRSSPLLRRLRLGAAGPISLLVGVGLWELIGRLSDLAWLPPFSQVVDRLVELVRADLIQVNLASSLEAMAIGFAFSALVALALGALMAWFPLVDRALGVYVYAFFVLPSIALAPVFLALFGASNTTRLAVIISNCLFVMIQNFRTAFQHSADDELVQMARAYGARRREVARFVVFPSAGPMVFATLRIGVGRALKGMINGEQFIAVFGLGGLVQRYGSQFDSVSVFAILLVIVAIALALDWIVRLLDRRVTRWMD
jgi:NitT/TauT family transport system permease protein